jgi:tRNA/tmRNA/rRNA uracil-C5-methylase (TrmA/RlmC/RlmD family)
MTVKRMGQSYKRQLMWNSGGICQTTCKKDKMQIRYKTNYVMTKMGIIKQQMLIKHSPVLMKVQHFRRKWTRATYRSKDSDKMKLLSSLWNHSHAQESQKCKVKLEKKMNATSVVIKATLGH